MFKGAKGGDRVWSFVYGWGTITSITCGRSYPLSIRFDNGCSESYTFEGKRINAEANRTLFWNEIKFEVPPKPKQTVKKWVCFFINPREDATTLKVSGIGIIPHLYDTLEEAKQQEEQKGSYNNFYSEIKFEI